MPSADSQRIWGSFPFSVSFYGQALFYDFVFAVVLLLIINMSVKVIVILCQSQNVGMGSKDIKPPASLKQTL